MRPLRSRLATPSPPRPHPNTATRTTANTPFQTRTTSRRESEKIPASSIDRPEGEGKTPGRSLNRRRGGEGIESDGGGWRELHGTRNLSLFSAGSAVPACTIDRVAVARWCLLTTGDLCWRAQDKVEAAADDVVIDGAGVGVGDAGEEEEEEMAPVEPLPEPLDDCGPVAWPMPDFCPLTVSDSILLLHLDSIRTPHRTVSFLHRP